MEFVHPAIRWLLLEDKMENYHEWTSCQMYGHRFYESETRPGVHVCQDCHEEYEDTEDKNESEASNS